MKRSTMMKILNLMLAILTVSQMLTGLFVGRMQYETFEILHKGGGYLFTAAAALHLILNWGWVKANFFKRASAVRS